MQDVLFSLLLVIITILALLIFRYLIKKQDKFIKVIKKLFMQYYYFIFLFV